MPERDTNVLEVLVGQVGQYRGVNFIFSKTLRVLPETKLPKPVRNLLHVSPPDLPASGRQLDSLSTSRRNPLWANSGQWRIHSITSSA